MKLFHLIVGLATICFLWSCQSSKHLSTETGNSAAVDSVNYTLIYIVHGDAGYLYHDADGEGKQADEQIVKEAKEVAQTAKNGEVFIFHQRPEKKVLWLFPQKDRLLYHYRRGELVKRQKYSPTSSKESFTKEASLYNRLRNKHTDRKVFLYFGHQIPDKGIPYHYSRKDARFSVDTFIHGAKKFLNEKERFDLSILSTCQNGTPEMASRMAKYSNSMLASPKNLHLSHIDTDSLLKLEENPDLPEVQLGRVVAENTFQRLSQFIQTAVTLSVYDLQQDREKLNATAKAYRKYRKNSTAEINTENIDCATLSFKENIELPVVNEVFYKPPRFGTKNAQDSFSGWGCKE